MWRPGAKSGIFDVSVCLPDSTFGVWRALGCSPAVLCAAELQEYLSAKERRRTQPGLKLLSFRLTVSLPHGMPARLTGPRAILGDFAPIHSDV